MNKAELSGERLSDRGQPKKDTKKISREMPLVSHRCVVKNFARQRINGGPSIFIILKPLGNVPGEIRLWIPRKSHIASQFLKAVGVGGNKAGVRGEIREIKNSPVIMDVLSGNVVGFRSIANKA